MGKESGPSEKRQKKGGEKHVNRDKGFKSSTVKAFKGLNCFYTNADSLPNKLEELKGRMQSATEKFDVIGITEIYPKNCRYLPGKAELSIQGYELFLNEKKDNGRGIALYIRQDLRAEEVRMEGEFRESIWTKIKLAGNDCLLIGRMYRSPSGESENVTFMNEMIRKAAESREFSHLLIFGDFNFPGLNWKTWDSNENREGEKFMECVRDCYLYQ